VVQGRRFVSQSSAQRHCYSHREKVRVTSKKFKDRCQWWQRVTVQGFRGLAMIINQQDNDSGKALNNKLELFGWVLDRHSKQWLRTMLRLHVHLKRNALICLWLATHRASSCRTHRVVTHSWKIRLSAYGTSCATSPIYYSSEEACSEEQGTIAMRRWSMRRNGCIFWTTTMTHVQRNTFCSVSF